LRLVESRVKKLFDPKFNIPCFTRAGDRWWEEEEFLTS
jgi:hypothetical protein